MASTSKRASGRKRRSRKKTTTKSTGIIRVLAYVLGLGLFASIGAAAWLMLSYPNRPANGPRRSFAFSVRASADIQSVSRSLAHAGAVESPWLWAVYMRVIGADQRLRRGATVMLTGRLTPRDVAQRVAHGLGPTWVRVTIPEGSTMFDIAERLAQHRVCPEDEFVAAARSAELLTLVDAPRVSLEGYLFPDTYEFREDTPAALVVERMVRNWKRRLDEWLSNHPQALTSVADLEWSLHDVVTLASVVEKEAAVREERATIAGVFLNRLRSDSFLPRHRLQADPTVSYGCRAEPAQAASCANFAGTITRAMLDDDRNRYNTYRHAGLPPGPISNPGLSTMQSVLMPAKHDYLYFVARGNRRHTFSADLRNHNRAVRKMRGR